MIRLGIVGTNYGRTVQLAGVPRRPALRGGGARRQRRGAHRRSSRTKPASPRATATGALWSRIRTSTPSPSPRCRACRQQIAIRALELGKPVFIEKPMAPISASAGAMLRQATLSRQADLHRFQFPPDPELAARQGDARRRHHRRACATSSVQLAGGKPRASRCACATGRPSAATTAAACSAISSAIVSIISNGSCGPIAGLSARIAGLPDDAATGNDGDDGLAIREQARSSACR